MKKMVVAAITIALLGFSAPSFAADEEMKFSFGAKAGWFIFQDEPMSDFIENNWSIGGQVILWLPAGFGIGADIQYLNKDEEGVSHAGAQVDIEYTQIPMNVNAYYLFPMESSEFKPYIGAGLSWVMTDLTAELPGTSVSFTSDDDGFGWNAVLGAQYGMFFVEGQYLWAEVELEHPGLDTQDMNVGGFSFWAGVRF